jgi:hypothetical protein
MSCTQSNAPPTTPNAVVELQPNARLLRASMALRGIRPSLLDIEAIEANSAALNGIVEQYIASPDFGETIRWWQTEMWQLQSEQFYPATPNSPLFGKTGAEISDAVFGETGRLAEYIVTHDRPFTEFVTADYTMMNGITAAIQGMQHTAASEEWTVTPWNGQRPAAGALATTSIYNRHFSAGSNFNRGRANVISTVLLCHNYLDNDVVLDTSIDLSDPEVVSNAVVSNRTCAGCHQTLDPLASALFGFSPNPELAKVIEYPRVPSAYRKSLEGKWQQTNHRPPQYFGAPLTGLEQLGQSIASDRRFAWCTVARLASELLQVPRSSLEISWLNKLTDDYVAGGHKVKALAKAIVMSSDFAVSHGDPNHSDGSFDDNVVGFHRATPRQWAKTIEDLTGFRWRFELNRNALSPAYERSRNCDAQGQNCDPTKPPFEGTRGGTIDIMTNNQIGFNLLGGGTDAFNTPEPLRTMGPTSLVVLQALATNAASDVIRRESLQSLPDRKLFANFDFATTDAGQIKQQLAMLSRRIFADSPELASQRADELSVLYSTIANSSGSVRAWTVVLTTMLSDPEMAYF